MQHHTVISPKKSSIVSSNKSLASYSHATVAGTPWVHWHCIFRGRPHWRPCCSCGGNSILQGMCSVWSWPVFVSWRQDSVRRVNSLASCFPAIAQPPINIFHIPLIEPQFACVYVQIGSLSKLYIFLDVNMEKRISSHLAVCVVVSILNFGM